MLVCKEDGQIQQTAYSQHNWYGGVEGTPGGLIGGWWGG